MSGKTHPHQSTVQHPKRRDTRARPRLTRVQAIALAVGLAAAIAAAAIVVGRSGGSNEAPGVASGPAPAFAERDAVSGEPVSSAALRGRNVLLFFSEGAMCAPCFQQIEALEQRSDDLKRRGLQLVSITPDSTDVLRQAADAYGIDTPLISDEDREMSRAYGVLGVKGAMHADTPGHTFVLVDAGGQIRWRRDYEEMFVEPDDLLGAMPAVGGRA